MTQRIGTIVARLQEKSAELADTLLPETLSKISRLNSENILELKNYFTGNDAYGGWTPKDAAEAIWMKNIQHLFKAGDKHISKKCEEKLDECKFCDNVQVDPATGLKVLRKDKPKIKTYNQTQEIIRIEAELSELEFRRNELQEELKDARKRAGHIEQHAGHMYVTKL